MLRITFAVIVSLVLAFFQNASLFAQITPIVKPSYADELPRIAPKEPEAAMAEIQVQPGYRLELAAAEPLVRDPVAMSFDEDGRLFVVEMCDYSEQDKDFLGNVRLLEDTDNDGRYDKRVLHRTFGTSRILTVMANPMCNVKCSRGLAGKTCKAC
jgi:hypothetical protein